MAKVDGVVDQTESQAATIIDSSKKNLFQDDSCRFQPLSQIFGSDISILSSVRRPVPHRELLSREGPTAAMTDVDNPFSSMASLEQ